MRSSSFFRGRERYKLARGAHDVISWEKLVEEGVTVDEVLDAHASHFFAFVRTEAAKAVTWREISQLDRHLRISRLFFTPFGESLDATNGRFLNLQTSDISAEDVALSEWSPAKWADLIGAVPRFQSDAGVRSFGMTLTL